MRSALRYIIALILSGGALYLAFRDQDITMLQEELGRSNLLALAAGSLIQILAHLLRAWRWRYLLYPFKKHTNLYTGFKAVMAGYALNNVIPRSGEVARPLIIAKREHIPFTGAFGTIVLERVFDILIVGVFLLISYLLYADKLLASFPELIDTVTTLVIIFALGLGLFVAAVLNKKMHDLIESLITKVFPKKIGTTINRLFTTFTNGLRGLNRKTAMPLLGGTVLVWFLYWLSMYAFLFVFPGGDDFMIGIGGTTLLLTLSAVSVAIPTPGGIGTYHYFISQTLILVFGITATRAIAFATISHFAPYLVVTVIGIFFTLAEGVSLKLSDVKKKSPDDGALGS